MTMTPDEIWTAVSAARTGMIDLLDDLADADWDQPSLCAGWRIREVVAHVVISSDPNTLRLLAELAKARGSIARLNFDMALRHTDGATPAQLLAEMRACVPLRKTPLGTTPADRLMDVLVHTGDIAIPLGRRCEIPTAAGILALERVWDTNWLFHAKQRLGGFRLVATDADWAVGSGPRVEGPVGALLMLASGREVFAELTGDGAAQLSSARGGHARPV